MVILNIQSLFRNNRYHMTKLKHSKEIFDILKRGSFISQNSTDAACARYYSEIEDNLQAYADYYEGVGYVLEGENGYFYFSKLDNEQKLEDKLLRLTQWIDRVDFLKTYNNTFSTGLSFLKSDLVLRLTDDIELKEKARSLYTDTETGAGKMDKLIQDLLRMGFIELEDKEDERYRVVAAFRYIESLIDCITIYEQEEE